MSYEEAIDEMLRFTAKSHQSALWEKIVGGSSEFHGVVCCLALPVPQSRMQEIVDRVSAELRARYPELTKTSKVWTARRGNWSREEAAEVVEFIRVSVLECLSRVAPVARTIAQAPPAVLERARNLPEQTLSPWQPFFARRHVPASPGLYIFGRYPALPSTVIDPLAPDVVYLGMTSESLDARLIHFENSWRGKTGHSGAFTLRNALLHEYGDEVLHGHTLFVGWMWSAPDDAATIRPEENRLIMAYKAKHRRWPMGNTKD